MGFNGINGGAGGLGNKKVEPTFGVSFGLPYPSYGYPLNPYGPNPAQNPYFGSISPNGLNLGVVNVNPLVSFQVTKNDYGEKVLKPLVNLHVTPNEHLIHKVGNLFHAKKHGIKEAFYNKHYHQHTHYPNPPEVYYPEHHHHHGPPSYHGPPSHHHGPPHGGHYGHYPSSGPSGFGGGGGGYGFPTGPYRDNSGPGGYSSGVELDYDPSGGHYSRNANVSSDLQNQYNYQNVYPQTQSGFQPSGSGQYNYQQDNSYANRYNYPQAPGGGRGSKNVAFPTNRKRRSVEEEVDNIDQVTNATTSEGRSNAEKVNVYRTAQQSDTESSALSK